MKANRVTPGSTVNSTTAVFGFVTIPDTSASAGLCCITRSVDVVCLPMAALREEVGHKEEGN